MSKDAAPYNPIKVAKAYPGFLSLPCFWFHRA